MQNKEIEEAKKEMNIITTTIKEILQKDVKITDEEVYTLDGRQYLAIENLLQYIDQLENKVKELECDNHNKENKITEQEIFLQMSTEGIKNSLLKQVIRDKIEEINKEYNEILNDYGNIDTDITFNIPNENVRKHLDELVIKIITLQELLEVK